jgi:hypothetical protein
MVIETTLATGPSAATPPPKWVRRLVPESLVRGVIWLLRRVLPLANADFEEVYDSVRNWWVEIDADSRRADRPKHGLLDRLTCGV